MKFVNFSLIKFKFLTLKISKKNNLNNKNKSKIYFFKLKKNAKKIYK